MQHLDLKRFRPDYGFNSGVTCILPMWTLRKARDVDVCVEGVGGNADRTLKAI
jgi:hypothetical protein